MFLIRRDVLKFKGEVEKGFPELFLRPLFRLQNKLLQHFHRPFLDFQICFFLCLRVCVSAATHQGCTS